MKSTFETGERCEVRIDRMVGRSHDREIPTVEGFRTVRDTRVRPQSKIATYTRVKHLRSEAYSAEIFLQYQPVLPWLAAQRITLIPERGLTPDQLNKIWYTWQQHTISTVEWANDFHRDTAVDEDFVLRHARFGKSRRRKDRGGPGQLRYGSRASPKMVRCYWKKERGRYRVELELHSPWLRKHGVRTVADLPTIASAVWPAHICFKVMRWEKLRSHLIRRYGQQRGETLLKEARGHADISLHRVNRFLSKTVFNPHRFWGSSIVNRDIREALQRWTEEFSPVS